MTAALIATQLESERTHLQEILEAETECKVVAAVGNGIRVVEQYKEHSPHVVILDPMLPECSGIKAAVAIENLSNNSPQLIFCTKIQRQETKSVLSGEERWYIHKPFDPEEVQKVVSDTIRSTDG